MKPFELPETTATTCTAVNVRRELHGDVRVLALDLKFRLEGDSTLLNRIEPGLRDEYFHDASKKKGQKALLPDAPLPNLRRPKVKNEEIAWDKGSKSRGYRFQLDFGLQEALVDLTDAVMYGVTFDCFEGGTAAIDFGVQYNGDDLEDDEVLATLVRLVTTQVCHIRLLAPPEVLKVGKGYRAGHKDTPQTEGDGNPDQGKLGDGTTDGGDAADPSTPTGAFVAAGQPAVTH